MAQGILSRFGLNRGGERYGQGSGWNRLPHMRIDALGLRLGKVVGGWWHKGCCIDDKVRQQGRHVKSVGYPDIQGERGKSWMKKAF